MSLLPDESYKENPWDKYDETPPMYIKRETPPVYNTTSPESIQYYDDPTNDNTPPPLDYGKKYNKDGYDKEGYNRIGYNRNGYNREGYNDAGYNKYGIDKNGYNLRGLDKDGYDDEGYDVYGFNKYGLTREGYDKNKIRNGVKDEAGYIASREKAHERAVFFLEKEKDYIHKYGKPIEPGIKIETIWLFILIAGIITVIILYFVDVINPPKFFKHIPILSLL